MTDFSSSTTTITTDALHWAAADWVLPVGRPPIAHGFVQWQHGIIQAVGALSELAPSQQTALLGTLRSNETTYLTPGLVNTHAHLELSYAEGMVPLDSTTETMANWLGKVMALMRTSTEPVETRCQRGVQQLLASGTTLVNDIARTAAPFQALEQVGLRGVVSLEFFHPSWDGVEITAATEIFQQQFEPYRRHPRLRLGLSPHAPYNVSPAAWHAMVAACQPSVIHSHVAESLDELRWLQGQPNGLDTLHQRILGRTFQPQSPVAPTPLAYLHQHGCFNSLIPTVLAHGIECTTDEWALLETLPHVGVSSCPRSNWWLHQRTLPSNVPLEKLSLGTDSLVSCPELDVRAEARWAFQHHGWPVETILAMLTTQGASQLGFGDALGKLQPGYHADLVRWAGPSTITEAPTATWLAETVTTQQVWVGGQCVFQA